MTCGHERWSDGMEETFEGRACYELAGLQKIWRQRADRLRRQTGIGPSNRVRTWTGTELGEEAPVNARRPMADDYFEDNADLDGDLALLECMTGARKAFLDEICEQSESQDEQVLGMLRLDSAYLFAEFLYLLRARGIKSEEQIAMLADLHNQYIIELMKDEQKVIRLGLRPDRLLDAIFTADTMPRLSQHWRECPGAIDQSNMARFLFTLMSSESCRKVVVACEAAGFVSRQKTPFGTTLIVSKGILEGIFGKYLRNLRRSIAPGDRS